MSEANRWSVSLWKRVRALWIAVPVILLVGCSGGGGGGGGSSPAVTTPPVISAQPQSQRVDDGRQATFAVTVASSTPVTYQWARNGVAIAGATGATYSIPAAQPSDEGAAFTVTVANAAGSVTSAPATLNVVPVAPTIANNVPTTVSVLAGQTATFAVTVTGTTPLAFQWRRAGVPIGGATAASYTTPPTAVAADNGATFDVVVTNSVGTVTSAPFTLVVTAQAQAPAIAAQPQSITIRAGDPATFTVSATGTAPLAYQWLRNGTAIPGAQAASYTLTSTALSDSGAQFTVVVTNAAGTVTSAAAVLTVTPQPSIALLAGNIGGPGSIDGTGVTARFSAPTQVAIENGGILYVADASSHTIRRVTADGVVTTLAGKPEVPGSTDGTGGAAAFNQPSGIAIDGNGNVLVADTGNHTIRRITPQGAVVTIAGTPGVFGSADGTGGTATFRSPAGIVIDGAGNLYVSDTGNHAIRRISAAGVVTTVAGNPGIPGFADGTGTGAAFTTPRQLVLEGASTLYVADTGNHVVRRVTTAGVVTTVAGRPGVAGSADGTGTAAAFNAPSGLAIDAGGLLYVADGQNHAVRRLTTTGVVTTVAGTGAAGSVDATGRAASFFNPFGLATDPSGVLYVADRDNFAVRRITTAGVVTTVAGAPAAQGSTDGTGAAARFSVPYGIAVDAAGNVFVADYFNAVIRRVTPAGVVTTLAGTAPLTGTADGTGAAARFATPQGLAVDGAGNVYVADKVAQTIRKVTPAGVVTTLAGAAGQRGSADGTGTAARFNDPAGIAVDGAGNLYVTDNNPTIRRITPAGVVTTIAGAAGRIGAIDGPGSVASFRFPQGIAVDASGTVYVADASNAVIRRIDTGNNVTTFAGVAGATGSLDGPRAGATFTLPTGIAIDRANNVYVADLTGRTIRRIDAAGNVSTLVGVADNRRGVRLGALPGHLDLPVQLAVDNAGLLYATDANAVLKITLP